MCYCPIGYKRKKDQKVELSAIVEALIQWFDKLENELKKCDKTELISGVFQFSEIKKVAKEIGEKGIDATVNFKGSNVRANSMLAEFFIRQSTSVRLILKDVLGIIQKNDLKDLSIEDLNSRLKNGDGAVETLFYKQEEFYKYARGSSGSNGKKEIKEEFIENIDALFKTMTGFYEGFDSDNTIPNITRDLKLLGNEKKEFARYLKVRRGTKDLLKNIEGDLSKIYNKILSENNEIKSHFEHSEQLNPQNYFESIKKNIKTETKTTVSYNELIEILKDVNKYLTKFKSAIKKFDNNLIEENTTKKRNLIEKFKFKFKSKKNKLNYPDKLVESASKSLEKEIKKLQNCQNKYARE